MSFLEIISEQVIVLDGAMGTLLQELRLPDSAFGGADFRMLGDLLTFSRPDSLKDIHLQYLHAGANAIETNSFGASGLRLKEYDFSRLDTKDFQIFPAGLDLSHLNYDLMAYHLSRQSALLAREAINEYKKTPSYDQRPLFVFGSMGPSNWVLSSTKAQLRMASYQMILDNFYHQTLGFIDGGADVCVFETQQDSLELKAAIHGAQRAMRERQVRLPILVLVTVDPFGKMQIFHTDILAVLATVQGIGIDVFGINCSIGPGQMKNTVQRLSDYSKLPIAVVPNAGMPISESGETVYKLSPEDLSQHLVSFVEEHGVSLVGGCCGTRPEHIEVLSQAVKGLRPKKRKIAPRILLSGPQNSFVFDSSQSLIRIGERLNVRGSLKVRQAVESGMNLDFHALEEVVREQVHDLGLDIIDVCMDSNQVDTDQVLVDVIHEMTTDFQGILCIDSFSAEALIKAVQVYPGRPIINSISLEEYAPGLDKIDAIVEPTIQHDPMYIALATDSKGPAVIAKDKAAMAQAIYKKCHTKYGVRADQLIIDINAFPIGSENRDTLNFAMESLDSIPLVKAIHPDLSVSIGVGNLTNGLSKKPYMRRVITSVFLHMARERGLDAAIVNPHHYVPVESLDPAHVCLAEKIISNRDMDAFAELEKIADLKKGVPVKKCDYEGLSIEKSICQKIKDGYKQRQRGRIERNGFVYEYDDAIVEQVAQVIDSMDPLDFINAHLMLSMKELGDRFGQGEVSLPHLLKSADVMKSAMGYIEAYIRHKSGADVHEQVPYKGTVILGTVYQDVHCIGKDLVKTLLENYGYRVIDLGVQTQLEKFVQEAQKHKATAIGMSALLVQTSNHMITVAKMLEEAGLGEIDILIGGAPVNHRHAAFVGMRGQKDVSRLAKNVFYCSSGIDGVNTLNQLLESSDQRERLYEENLTKLRWHYEQALNQQYRKTERLQTLPRRNVQHDLNLKINSPKYQTTVISRSLQQLLPKLDLKTLFSLNWRYGGKSSWQKKGLTEDDLKKQLQEWVVNCDNNHWILPKAVVGLFPCQSDQDSLIIYDQKNLTVPLAQVPFDVILGANHKDIFSVAQYFIPKGSSQYDVVGLFISSVGSQVEKQIQKFKESGDSESTLLLQGLSDRVAEDMAEEAHQHLRQALGLSQRQGLRYSPGYPCLSQLKTNQTIASLLNASKSLNISLTEAHEFSPTSTTAAIACFHPDARYD